MKLEKLQFSNFRSFSGEHVFIFPTEPGLYCITGQNKDNPRLGRNGIGKSSLLDAIYWCLYGRTTRGLRGGDVVTRGKKGCSVTLTFMVGDHKRCVARTQNPNSLALDGDPVDQEAVDKAIYIGPEAFLYAVMLPQFGDSFFDLKPAQKLEVFSEILKLGFWSDLSRKANSKSEVLLKQKHTKDIALTKIQAELDVINSDVKKMSELQTSFEKEKEKEIAILDSKVKGQKDFLLKEEKRLKSAKAAHLGAEQRLTALPTSDLLLCNHKVSALRVTLAKLDSTGAQCPHCLQTVPQGHLKAEKARLKAELVIAEAEAKKAAEAEKNRKIITQNKDDFSREIRQIENSILSINKDIEHLLAKMKTVSKEINPYSRMLESYKNDIECLNEELTKVQEEINTVQKSYTANNYWVSGFKKIKLFVIEKALKQLEIEVNNNFAALGLIDWRVEFDVERENKSGGLTKGFTVLVYAPECKDPIKYESWCGGETQRLRLAGDLGLANLIMGQAGISNKFEAFDEPSAHMGQEGLNDLVELLAARAEADNKVIFLVDHHTIEYGGFAGEIVITKDKGGSKCLTT